MDQIDGPNTSIVKYGPPFNISIPKGMTIEVALADNDYLEECATTMGHSLEVLVTFVSHALRKQSIQDWKKKNPGKSTIEMVDPSNVAICIFLIDHKQDGWAAGSKQATSKHGQKIEKKFGTPWLTA